MAGIELRNAILVTPKRESFEAKGFVEQSHIELKLKNFIQSILDKGISIRAFREDVSAYKLFGDKLEYIGLVGDADMSFVKGMDTDIDDDYFHIPTVKTSRYLREAIKKYKPVMLSPEAMQDDLEVQKWNLKRMSNIRQRKRYAANKEMEDVTFVIFVSAGSQNNWCNCPTAEVGDGKLIIHYDLVTDIVTYTYGGIKLDESILNML